MTEQTDTCQFVLSIQFATAGISIHPYAVNLYLALSIFCHRPFVRPNGRTASSIMLSLTCIENIYLFYFTVTIPVVISEIHQILSEQRCFPNHGSNTFQTISSSVITTFLRYFYRTYHVEIQLKLSVTLRQEIILHTPFEGIL